MVTLSPENSAILTTLFSAIIIFGVIGNSCVIYSILISKVNRKNFKNYYVLALSIADVLYCLLNPSYMLIGISNPKVKPPDEIFCRIMSFISFTLGSAGIMAITALSLDRYIALKYPFLHRRYQEPRVAFLVNLVVYMYPLAWYFPLLVIEGWVACSEFSPAVGNVSRVYSFSSFFLLVVVPGVTLTFTNVYVFISARKRYSVRKNRGKLNRVFPPLEVNQVSESSRKKSNSETRMNTLTDTVSSEDTIHNQSAMVTIGIDPNDSSNHRTLKVTGFESQALSQKKDFIADATDQKKPTNIEKHVSVGNRVKRNSKTEKQLKEQGMQREWKMVLMTVTLVVAFFITFLPFAVSRSVSISAGIRLSPAVVHYTTAWSTFNSVINPYIVLATRDDIRKVVLGRE